MCTGNYALYALVIKRSFLQVYYYGLMWSVEGDKRQECLLKSLFVTRDWVETCFPGIGRDPFLRLAVTALLEPRLSSCICCQFIHCTALHLLLHHTTKCCNALHHPPPSTTLCTKCCNAPPCSTFPLKYQIEDSSAPGSSLLSIIFCTHSFAKKYFSVYLSLYSCLCVYFYANLYVY